MMTFITQTVRESRADSMSGSWNDSVRVLRVSHPRHSHRVRASLGPSAVCWVLPSAARRPMWGRLHPVLALYPLERDPRTSASHPGPGRRRVSGWRSHTSPLRASGGSFGLDAGGAPQRQSGAMLVLSVPPGPRLLTDPGSEGSGGRGPLPLEVGGVHAAGLPSPRTQFLTKLRGLLE